MVPASVRAELRFEGSVCRRSGRSLVPGTQDTGRQGLQGGAEAGEAVSAGHGAAALVRPCLVAVVGIRR